MSAIQFCINVCQSALFSLKILTYTPTQSPDCRQPDQRYCLPAFADTLPGHRVTTYYRLDQCQQFVGLENKNQFPVHNRYSIYYLAHQPLYHLFSQALLFSA